MWVCRIGPGTGGDAGKYELDRVGNGVRAVQGVGGLPPATALVGARYLGPLPG
jgi:hypothetical protein